MTSAPWWKRIIRVIFWPVVTLIIEEIGQKLEDPKDPYPKS